MRHDRHASRLEPSINARVGIDPARRRLHYRWMLAGTLLAFTLVLHALDASRSYQNPNAIDFWLPPPTGQATPNTSPAR